MYSFPMSSVALSSSIIYHPYSSMKLFQESSENNWLFKVFLGEKLLCCQVILVILLKSMSAFRILSYPSSFFRNVKTLNGSDFAGRILDVYLIFVDFPIKPFYD